MASATRLPASKMTLDEIANYIAEDENWNDDVAIFPPIEISEAKSDEDSDVSDQCEQLSSIDHLPARILRSDVEVFYDVYNDEHEECEVNTSPIKAKRPKKVSREWKKSNSSSFTPPPFVHDVPSEFHSTRSSISRPADSFYVFFDENFFETLINETNLYACQNDFYLNVSIDEMKTFIALILRSGYFRLPSKRLHWCKDTDVSSDGASQFMRRDRFENILRYLHFNNNSLINNDRFYKVRSLFEYFNKKSKIHPFTKELSIDESMIKYFGCHGSKQYMRAKPIKFGYKLWSVASPDGYLYHLEPYCGAGSKTHEYGLGHGGNVVASLVEACNVKPGSQLYFDNYFGSLHLLDYLSELDISATSTLRSNRVEGCPILGASLIRKNERGYFETYSDGKNIVTQWMDNKNVIVVSNTFSSTPVKSVRRYDRSRRQYTKLSFPFVIQKYNEGMGGVDLADQCINNYRITIRSRKWYYPIFSWICNALLVNSWRYFQDVRGKHVSLLDYQRMVVNAILAEHGERSRRTGRPSILSTVISDTRFDGRNHWPIKSSISSGRCGLCKGRTDLRCEKCDVALHPKCFKKFHVQ